MIRSGAARRASGNPWSAWPFGAHGRRRGSAGDIRWLRHVPIALFVLGILAYGAAFAWDMLHSFDLLNLVRDGFRDDAYYYYQIAYHMAEGRFSTFDGGLTRTNGYHPLWLFLVTPFYWIFDKTEALFAVKAFEIVLLAGGVALVAVAARAARLPWILLFAALPALYAQPSMLLGMESALALFTLGLLFVAVCLFAGDPARWRWLLAAVLFALPWARLEYLAIAVAVPAALCFIEWTGRLPGAAETATDGSSSGAPGLARFRLALPQAAVPLAGALAGMLVYFAYNGIVFGGVLPVSGATKAFWSHRRFREEGGYDLAANFDAFMHSIFFDDELLTALEVCLYTLLVWWLSHRFRSREGRLLLAFMVGVFGLAAGHLAKFAYSVLFVHPDFGKFAWYYIPAYLMEALVVPVRCFVGLYVLRCVLGRRLPRTSDVLRFGGIVVVGVALLAKADFAAPFRFVDTHDKLWFHGEGDLHAYSGVAAMNRLLPQNALVGAFDSGVVGYFARAQVMNLDGLVNSYGNKEALADRGNNVFDLFGFSYVGNIYYKKQPSHSLIGDARPVFETHANGLSHQRRGPKQFRLYSPHESPRFREKMAARLERQADGTRLLTEGRLAQAFATDCAADEVAAWSFGQPEERAVSTWTRTADGSCSTAVVVPKGSSSPVRVQRMSLDDAVAFRVGGQRPAIKGEFDVYLLERRLFYVKELCERADVETRFFLQLVPVGDDFDEGRESLGFNNANFMLEEYGGGRASWGEEGSPCLAEVPLPKYEIATASTGQFKAEGPVWEGVAPIDLERNAEGVGFSVAGRAAQAFALECAVDEVALWSFAAPEKRAISTWTRTAAGSCMSVFMPQHGHSAPVRVRRATLEEALAQRVGGQAPAIRADSTQLDGFDVHLAEDALVYVKEACEQANVETPFFLHIVPAGNDFNDGREVFGFNNLDFMFRHRGVWSGDGGTPCLAEVPLPEYDIAEIRTGQYRADDWHRVWEGEVRLDQPATEGA